jgi:hypothetical protein
MSSTGFHIPIQTNKASAVPPFLKTAAAFLDGKEGIIIGKVRSEAMVESSLAEPFDKLLKERLQRSFVHFNGSFYIYLLYINAH